MRVFCIYDLKSGKEHKWICEDVQNEEEESRRTSSGEKRKILKMVCKVLLPALVSIVIWWLTYERISEIRGYYAIGGEALIPSVIWYILYKAYDFLS